ncbi:MAG: epoxyqueuosine reductase [Tannerellaceae bacterium]|nr:epoxyqueuosine reductase [Tannerellaceae bacterium]
MNDLNQEIENRLKNQGAAWIHFVSISHLDKRQNRQLPNAIIFALPLTAAYIKEVSDTPNYVQARVEDNFNFADDDYLQTEHKAGEIADQLARFINEKGYKAISQSDEALLADNMFNFETKESVLPHKTIALLSGAGWIGKNNLFITPEYGAAQCLGSVLTDAPVETELHAPQSPKCGNCNTCAGICDKQVLKKKTWHTTVTRDEIVDVHGCSTCLKCLIHCPHTQTYMKRNIPKK